MNIGTNFGPIVGYKPKAPLLAKDARNGAPGRVAEIPSTSSGQALRRAKDALLRMTSLDNGSWCGFRQRRPQTLFQRGVYRRRRSQNPNRRGRVPHFSRSLREMGIFADTIPTLNQSSVEFSPPTKPRR